MLKSILPILVVAALATPALAEDSADWRFGGDAFMAGRTVTLSGDGVGDLFAAGNRVTARSEVAGSAHMAGRTVLLDNRVGGNFYGAGMDVELSGPVAGNATVMGESISVSEPVSGNLRAMGASIEVTAPVAGSAILGGENVVLDAAISGDLALATTDMEWGDMAKVGGQLHIYSDDPESISVPESVAPADRVTFHAQDEFDRSGGAAAAQPSLLTRLRNWIGGVIVVGLLGTMFAAVAPKTLSGLREAALDRPLRTGWIGFLGLSALAGSVIFLAMTGIGAILVPVSIIGAVLLGVVGYILGTYALGVWATGMAGRGAPDTTGERAIAAFSGAAIVAAVALVPWLGWLAVMAVFLIGAGALLVRLFAPGFHIDREAA